MPVRRLVTIGGNALFGARVDGVQASFQLPITYRGWKLEAGIGRIMAGLNWFRQGIQLLTTRPISFLPEALLVLQLAQSRDNDAAFFSLVHCHPLGVNPSGIYQ